MNGTQRLVIRGGIGLFHDRPAGDTAYNQVTNPPFNSSRVVRFGRLQDLSSATAVQGPAALAAIWPYESDIPASVQWNIGAQMALPWSSLLDVSYVGQHGYHRLSEIRGQVQVDINAPDIGAAFAASNQDPTLAASPTPGATALTTDFLRPYRGFGSIGMNLPQFHETFHSIQSAWSRRLRAGFAFGGSYTLTLTHHGNIWPLGSSQPPLRLQHNADGTFAIRADQAQYEELNKNMGTPRHILKMNAVWELPVVDTSSAVRRAVGAVINGWQLSGVLSAGSGAFYDVTYAYQGGISSVNLTGSPTYPQRLLLEPVSPVQRGSVFGAVAGQRRARVWTEHDDRVSRSHAGPRDCPKCASWQKPQPSTAHRRVQRAQHGGVQRARDDPAAQQSDGSNRS